MKKYILAVIVIVIAAGLFAVVQDSDSTTDSVQETPASTTEELEGSQVNLSPPTEAEKSVGDEKKEEISQQEEPAVTDTATVEIVDSSQYDSEVEVRAFVSNVIQDGECVITFTKGTLSFTETVPAYADASTTPCIALTLPRSSFAEPGTWDVEVVYTSNTITGSAIASLEVQ